MLDPVHLAAALGLVGIAGTALVVAGLAPHRAEQVAAVLVLVVIAGATALAAQNGLLLLLLFPGLFNGESYHPYFFLLDLAIVATLAAGVAEHVVQRRAVRIPHGGIAGLVALSALVSLPLGLPALRLEMGIVSWRHFLDGTQGGDPWSHLFYLRAVFHLLTGVGLYVLTANRPWSDALLRRTAIAATLVYAAVLVLGLAWWRVGPPRLFLTLHLHGDAPAFSGVGFNTSYFAQYALAYFPLALLVLLEPAPRWAQTVALGSAVLTGYAVLATLQKGAYAVLLVELALLLALLAWRGRGSLARWRTAPAAALAGLVLAVAVGLAFSETGSGAAARVVDLWRSGDPYRRHVLAVAGRMFADHWLLGIGTGQFAAAFEAYSARAPEFHWGWLSSHNLYAQFLAEQGLVGLLSFASLLGLALASVFAGDRPASRGDWRRLCLWLSLAGWATYGLFQYTFLLRAMQAYFWIVVGLLLALAWPRGAGWRPSRRVAAAGLLVLAVALVARVHAGVTRPLPPGLAVGVHVDPGQPVQWTTGHAILSARAEGPVLRVAVSCPIPGVRQRPQTVEVTLDGRPVGRVVIGDTAWQTLDIDVARPRGSTVLIGFRVGYTFVPRLIGLNEDGRRLGVLLGPLDWRQR